MGTYWDDFVKEYPQARTLPLVVVLEAFWRYSNNDKATAEAMMTSAPLPDTRGPEVKDCGSCKWGGYTRCAAPFGLPISCKPSEDNFSSWEPCEGEEP